MDHWKPTMTQRRRHAPARKCDPQPLILNLGCGARTSPHCVNIDWSYYLLFRQFEWALPILSPIIGADRAAKIREMQGVTLYHDLRKGIPFADNSVDAVYHSHMMEHIDRDKVEPFQREILRVLKPNGVQRLCVPDLEALVDAYVRSVTSRDRSLAHARLHDSFVAELYEQSVRRDSEGIRGKSALRASIETHLIGDARRRGETHQWMWDRINIYAVLSEAGFTDIACVDWQNSTIANWRDICLEQTESGEEYKPGSLYIECRKPTPERARHAKERAIDVSASSTVAACEAS